jgi:hypothetical protein
MLKKITAAVLGLVFAGAMAQAAVNVSWLTFMGINDENGAPLAAGSVVQLLSAGANAVPDALSTVNAGLVGGDDTILDTLKIGDGVGGLAGYFLAGPTRFNAVAQTDTLFIRAFNAPSLDGLAKVFYGEGGLRSGFANPDCSPPPVPDQVIWGETAPGATSNQFLIPEPSTILLALAGGLMLVRKLRK